MRLQLVVLVVSLCLPAVAHAATYRVGTSAAATYRQLTELPALGPGDVVEVEGGTDYAGDVVFDFDSDGTAAMPVIVRGLVDGGVTRPRLIGGRNTLELQGDHYVLENLDLSGGTARCLYHHADDITVRDSVVHDCPAQGILGADNDSGSLTLERVEVHHCGAGDSQHQIYMATDEVAHPGSVFRMQYCWLHDANGGNNVKSRAERNEIYSNWIEGAYYHELELIGPDPAGGVGQEVAREDSDVVGNVLVKRGGNEGFSVVRFGGDATGQSEGRYRFAFNTVIVAPGAGAAVFRLFTRLESVEMHGNVFAMRGGGPVNLLHKIEAEWVRGRLVAGTNNWVSTDSTNVPPEWTGTLTGADPGLVDIDSLDTFDPSPASATSPVVDTGLSPTPAFADSPFTGPLDVPSASPVHGTGSVARPVVGVIDRGAYELGSGPPPFDGGVTPPTDGGSTPRVDGGARADGGTGATTTPSDGGCGCRAAGARTGATGPALLAAALGLACAWRRRRAPLRRGASR
jgi:hypothetical protein